MHKVEINNPALKSWDALNAAVRNADEAKCFALLKEETVGRYRLKFVLRIHSRLNKVRADRERREFLEGRIVQ